MATKEMMNVTPPEGMAVAGWLYMNDDGNGPFFTPKQPKRYLNEWPVFERTPSDGHVCARQGMAYGVCEQCERIDEA